MEQPNQEQVTELLLQWRAGDRASLDKLVTLVHEELRRIAHSYMVTERRRGLTFQTGALIDEAYLRLVRQEGVDCQSRADFLGIAAHLMREILCDRARRFNSKKRGGGRELLQLDEALVFSYAKSASLIALDEALNNLASFDARKAQIVEFQYFGGLTVNETADALRISRTTVVRDLKLAKAWLKRELTPPPKPPEARKAHHGG